MVVVEIIDPFVVDDGVSDKQEVVFRSDDDAELHLHLGEEMLV